MVSYPTHIFIETLGDSQHVKFLRNEREGDVTAAVFESVDGRAVFIDTSEDDIYEIEGRQYLRQLGLDYLIPSFFPENI
jgi:hypothetical protein